MGNGNGHWEWGIGNGELGIGNGELGMGMQGRFILNKKLRQIIVL
jgi:hypothetical protein